MDRLQVLKTLLQLTTEAEELTSDVMESERLRSLISEIRRKAREEYDRLRQGRPAIPARLL